MQDWVHVLRTAQILQGHSIAVADLDMFCPGIPAMVSCTSCHTVQCENDCGNHHHWLEKLMMCDSKTSHLNLNLATSNNKKCI